MVDITSPLKCKQVGGKKQNNKLFNNRMINYMQPVVAPKIMFRSNHGYLCNRGSNIYTIYQIFIDACL